MQDLQDARRGEMQPGTELATMLFLEVAGSARRAAELGDHRWHELLEQYHALVRGELPRWGGRESNTSGDRFLATFDDPERAIRCACAIREAVGARGIELRGGLHIGEVEEAEARAGGIAAHVGAQVASQAAAGEVLVSSTLKDLVAGSGIGFESRGVHTFRGLPGQWRLFAVSGEVAKVRRPPLTQARSVRVAAALLVLLAGLATVYVLTRPAGKAPESAEDAPLSSDPALAVMPFTTRGSGLEVWREGMVDLLSTNLDGVAGLRVIDSRTVLARWRERVKSDASVDLTETLEVARAAGAHYALMGSVLSSASDLVLNARVYEVQSGKKLGEVQEHGSPEKVFGLVDRLSVGIVRAVLQAEEAELPRLSVTRVTTDSLRALRAYLEGEDLFRRSEFRAAVAAYERAVEIDSTFALALYRLGVAASWLRLGRVPEEPLRRAVRLADRLPEREQVLVRAELALLEGTLDGIGPLEAAVQKYPDDAEIWYQLGETYYHLGAQALIEQEMSEQALSKAVELDPNFAPAYFHLVELAFTYTPDSTRAASLVEAYARLSGAEEVHLEDPEAQEDIHRDNRLALRLGFEGPRVRDRARAALAGLPTGSLVSIAFSLWHPRLRTAQDEVLRILALRIRLDPAGGGMASEFLFLNSLSRGNLDVALAQLDDPWMPEDFRSLGLYAVILRGGSPRPGQVERVLALAAPDSFPDARAFYAGAYAADRGKWSDHALAVARFRGYEEGFRAKGDSTQARFARAAADALEGYAWWRKGRTDQALRLLQAAQREATGWGERAAINGTLRFWTGRLLLELGRPAEAERYFKPREAERYASSFWQEPLASYYLGKIYEELERFGQARAAYEFFVAGWRTADPELQPLVEEATRAVARLTPAVAR